LDHGLAGGLVHSAPVSVIARAARRCSGDDSGLKNAVDDVNLAKLAFLLKTAVRRQARV
jgi:hypothetical protein